MSAAGDGEVAVLLSALAEAPDFDAATAFLLAQLVEVVGAGRGCVLRLDNATESVRLVASLGFDPVLAAPAADVSLGELSSPIVVSTLSMLTLRGNEPLAGSLGTITPWVVVPIAQTRDRAPRERMSAERAADLAGPSIEVIPRANERRNLSALGVVVFQGPIAAEELARATRILDLAGPVLARLGAFDDARRTLDRLDRERDRLTLMVDSLPDPVVITNARNDILAQNDRAERLLHARDDDSPGRRRAIELNNLLFSSFLSKATMAGDRVGGSRELNLVDPDEGNDLLFEVLAHPLGQRVGPDDAMLSVLRDVTDLRRAASELERQVQRTRQGEATMRGERDRLNLILENVADPILVTDERSNIILMNEQAEQLFQIQESARQARREVASVRGNDTKFTSFISEFALLDDNARRERMSLTQPRTGVELPVEVVSGKVRNDRGEPIAIVSVLHDLTKQVENERLYEALKRFNAELEMRIREATADLAEQNARLQWQSQEVERATKLKSEFLASMSHELRTPINALIGYSALLLDGVLGEVNPRQRDALMRGRTAAEHLLALINDILDLAKIEAGKMPLHPEDVPLRDVTLEVTQQIEPMMRKKQLDFVIDIAADCPIIYSDSTKIKQVLLNLLSNAVKFTTKGRVTVAAHCAPGGVRIDVMDTGIGIRQSDLQAIWEDFRQVDQSRTREFGGTGLGLSITRKLLERLGGSVTVQSSYGEGSTFSVFLPERIPMAAASEYSPVGVSS